MYGCGHNTVTRASHPFFGDDVPRVYQQLPRSLSAILEGEIGSVVAFDGDFYDRDLRKLFSDAPEHAGNLPAAKFLTRVRRDVRRLVARWTGEYQYRIDQVLNDMIARCEVIGLHLATPEDRAKPDFMVLLTVQTMNYLHGGRHRIAL